jgi:hypothetical protein
MPPTLLLLALLALPAFQVGAAGATVTGMVFEDLDGDGRRGPRERPLPGVAVSNQIEAVDSDAEGRFVLEQGFGLGVAFVIAPASHRPVGKFWRAPGERTAEGELEFPLAAAPVPESFSFLHASDPHVSRDSILRLERVKRIAAQRQPAFMLITGDLIRDALRVGEAEARGYFELYARMIASFPVPVFSALGNHDVFGIERHSSGVSIDHPAYGKRMYREYLGPNYYAFNFGRLHLVALDTVDVADQWYYGHIDQAQLDWLTRELTLAPKHASVVTFNHIPLYSTLPLLWGFVEGQNAGSTLIEIDGERHYRHTVSNAPELVARLRGRSWPLALGGHIHAREQIQYGTPAPATRFHQAAAVVGPNQAAGLDLASGVTLYQVRGTTIDDGEFIPLDPHPSR